MKTRNLYLAWGMGFLTGILTVIAYKQGARNRMRKRIEAWFTS